MTEAMSALAEGISRPNHEELTAGIVSAYVANNALPIAELPGLIKMVRSALVDVVTPGEGAVSEPAKRLTPAEVKKSITDKGLVSFIDGKAYQTLKRHLTKHGISAVEYRARFGLPPDYPMTAPAYAAKRSQIAKDLGLGNPARRAA